MFTWRDATLAEIVGPVNVGKEMAQFVTIKQYQVLVDDDMVEFVNSIKWSPSKPSQRSGNVYFRCFQRVNGVLGAKYHLHRYISNAPKHLAVDHINGNTLDNRRENLRCCTHAENMRNRGKSVNNKSGYRGVTFHNRDRKYQAQIKVDNKRLFLGYFETAEEAHFAYSEASKKYHGEFGHK